MTRRRNAVQTKGALAETKTERRSVESGAGDGRWCNKCRLGEFHNRKVQCSSLRVCGLAAKISSEEGKQAGQRVRAEGGCNR